MGRMRVIGVFQVRPISPPGVARVWGARNYNSRARSRKLAAFAIVQCALPLCIVHCALYSH